MASNATAVVQTVGLTKIFRDWWYRQRVVAVDQLDLDIRAHEVFGLLGPNGSGKSTTIKMILGLLYPTRGRISVFGYAPTDVAIKSKIGYLPEESYLYRFLNARETLDYYARLFQIPRQERHRRVEQLLEMVGLTREARRRVGEYSKGMARRIGLAQALINDPDLLILDEPTTGLDPIGTREIKDLIKFLNVEKRKTILLCSHLLGDVEDVCQRVVILYGGKRQAMGDIHELLSRQHLTQITSERLNETTIARIRELIAREESKHVVNVAAPSDKLETFFLRIVREAQQARQQTSGAAESGRIAGFLAEAAPAEGKDLVASLINAAERPAAVPEPVLAGAAVEADAGSADFINELVTTPARPIEAAPEQQQRPAAAPEEAVDLSVIDNLVRRDGRSPGQKE